MYSFMCAVTNSSDFVLFARNRDAAYLTCAASTRLMIGGFIVGFAIVKIHG